MTKNFYITTTLPYVNAEPHIGFALEIIQADTLARFHALQGDTVFFNFGTDEHGVKIYRKAQDLGRDPKEYTDEYAAKFSKLKEALNLSYNNFIRTTDGHHKTAAQEFWKRCLANGDIDKKLYKIKYCVGCELEKTDSELLEGRCPLHPNLEIEVYEEENYFFKFSKYQKTLLEFYDKNPDFVIPNSKYNEIKNFVKGGLEDFSISRLKSKLPWGVEVPDDPGHVMYVWFDALVNYISALGWPENEEKFNEFWPGVQVAGKDNLRQQTAIWQAMLMSAGLPNSKQVFIHGFITANGQKISKSLGNVVNPMELVDTYGTDATRYYLLSQIPSYEDGDYSEEKFKIVYNADLANGLGNLASRVSKLAEKVELAGAVKPLSFTSDVKINLEKYDFNKALEHIWGEIKKLDQKINEEKPWALEATALVSVLTDLVARISQVAYDLQPFLPEASEKILTQYTADKIKSAAPLFPRLS